MLRDQIVIYLGGVVGGWIKKSGGKKTKLSSSLSWIDTGLSLKMPVSNGQYIQEVSFLDFGVAANDINHQELISYEGE